MREFFAKSKTQKNSKKLQKTQKTPDVHHCNSCKITHVSTGIARKRVLPTKTTKTEICKRVPHCFAKSRGEEGTAVSGEALKGFKAIQPGGPLHAGETRRGRSRS